MLKQREILSNVINKNWRVCGWWWCTFGRTIRVGARSRLGCDTRRWASRCAMSNEDGSREWWDRDYAPRSARPIAMTLRGLPPIAETIISRLLRAIRSGRQSIVAMASRAADKTAQNVGQTAFGGIAAPARCFSDATTHKPFYRIRRRSSETIPR